ncbi:MAG: carboxypeptidase regulatory-like domain-containing protein [Chloroflexi bacterium]|nr:carboxypeptidase regulatory-like domain-containing protein [Chloroflexota bacterium]
MITSPGEGETFYSAPQRFLLSMPITGQVFSRGNPVDPATVEVTLELFGASGEHYETTTRLDDKGFFTSRASMLERDLALPANDAHMDETCGACHQSHVPLTLPLDVTHLVVTVRAEDGRTAQVTRTLRFDHSSYQPMVVTVDGLPGTAPVEVSATTRVYNWRRRTFLAAVSDGQASLSVERLIFADLVYEVSLVPIVVEGTLYTAPTQEVVVRPGEMPPAVTLTARETRGSIAGRVVRGASNEAMAAVVVVLNIATGEGVSASTDDEGRFAFADLPVTEHLLLARTPSGFHLPQRLDLLAAPETETTIHFTPAGGSTLKVRVLCDGVPLPFAEAEVSGLPVAHADPLTGVVELEAVPSEGALAVEIAAAGCYGVVLDSDSRDLGDVALTLRPDTTIVERGGWKLTVPAATQLVEQDDGFTLESGVVWGLAGDTSLRVGEFVLRGPGAYFALERVGASFPRLYVREGEMLAFRDGWDEPVPVTTGQVMVLSDPAARPVDLVSGAGPLLRADAGSVSPFVAAPSPEAVRAQTVNAALVTVAQGFMLAAYGLTFVVAPALLIVGAVILVKTRRRARKSV